MINLGKDQGISMPTQCVLICAALGVYWLCFPIQPNQIKLFPGDRQYGRFQMALQRLLNKPDVFTELRRRGLVPSDLGSHSIRKGAATFVASGSTVCPPISAIHARAGWTMGKIHDTYIHHGDAGDMYVGRTVCGLPSNTPRFATMPPRFKDCTTEQIERLLRLCYPGIPGRLNYVCEFALASVLHHISYLKQTLPLDHMLRNTLPFREGVDIMDDCASKVVCEQSVDCEEVTATGIPPHVLHATILSKLSHKQDVMCKETVQDTVRGVVQELEDRAIGARAVTADAMLRMHGSSGCVAMGHRISPLARSSHPICPQKPCESVIVI
jgi:hypothetical protein